MLMLRKFVFGILLVGGIAILQPAQAKRVALVIGNSKYVHAVTLPNPSNDAHLLASTLRNSGFQVIEGVDQDNTGMHSLISRFTEQSYDADLAVIYYAGHGLEVDGKNYMIPIDAKLASDTDVTFEGVPLDQVMTSVNQAKKLRLVMLDACRDNPFAKQLALSSNRSAVSLNKGLGRIQSGSGTFIAFATQPDAVAADGSGRNSPFTTALLDHIAQPGLDIRLLFADVRRDVVNRTGGAQTP